MGDIEQLNIREEEKRKLETIAKKVFANCKGLLANDERDSTIESKFAPLGMENTPETRRTFRECLYCVDRIENYISGVILNEEAFGQCDSNGVLLTENLLKKGILLGLKVDKGLMSFGNGEQLSVGIDDLNNRIQEEKYKEVSFTKWRSFFKISVGTLPSDSCIEKNCIALSKFALICQKNGKVPIVEPEISYDGEHSIQEMAYIAKKVYSTLFKWMNTFNLFIPGVILKLSFITCGKNSNEHFKDLEEIGKINNKVISESIPSAIAGIVFLSGGHMSSESIDLLTAIQKHKINRDIPLSFSFGRALTSESLNTWKGKDSNKDKARSALIEAIKNSNKANMRGA